MYKRQYVDTCKQYGREVQNLECEYSFDQGQLVAEEILNRYPAVDGIISCNDMVAISVFKVLRRHGYQIPEDVQIIGFDNVALAHLITPELTTIPVSYTHLDVYKRQASDCGVLSGSACA